MLVSNILLKNITFFSQQVFPRLIINYKNLKFSLYKPWILYVTLQGKKAFERVANH